MSIHTDAITAVLTDPPSFTRTQPTVAIAHAVNADVAACANKRGGVRGAVAPREARSAARALGGKVEANRADGAIVAVPAV